jgi:YVTN family beta-propeller protein
MKKFYTKRLLSMCFGACLLGAAFLAQSETVVRIIQTNAAGSNAHVIDPATNEVVGIIEGVPRAHAAVNHPDGTNYYFANEHDESVDVVDVATLEVLQRIPLIDRPNKLVINKSLGKLYVGIRDAAFVQVIDIDTNEIIKAIPVFYGVHNVYVTADDKYIVAGLGKTPDTMDEPTIQVIDANTDEVVWGIPLAGHRVRPMAIESNADGSPSRIFAQGTRLNGFYVVDWDKREAVDFISPPPQPLSEQNFDGIQEGTGHGLLVLPDGSALWYASRLDSRVYAWSLPELEFLGGVKVGPSPQWLTATPDSQTLYISLVGSMETLALDTQTHEIVARIPVGFGPKRNSTHVFNVEAAP